jgi:hypothetical protein
MTYIEDMRTRLLGAKRVLGNIRNSVGAISEAIAYNLDDGICRPSVVPIATPQRQRKLRRPTKLALRGSAHDDGIAPYRGPR